MESKSKNSRKEERRRDCTTPACIWRAGYSICRLLISITLLFHIQQCCWYPGLDSG